MDEIQVLIPVAVKSKLTEALKTTLLNQINQNIKSVENDMTQLEFEANAKLAEQAKINMQAVAPLRAQYDAQKAQMIQVKDKLTADKEHLEKLTIGAELPRLPELVTSIVAARKNEVDMALGNAIGSNVFNILMVLGIASAISPISIITENIIDLCVLIAFTVCVWIFAGSKKKIGRVEGFCMVALYAAYAVYIIIR